MEIERRVLYVDSVESQHRTVFVQLQSRRTRKRKTSVQVTAPVVVVRRRLQNWRSSSRLQEMKINDWLQELNLWISPRNRMVRLSLLMMRNVQLIWMSCKLSWISVRSIFLTRCTMLHCVRNLMWSARKSRMPNQYRLRSPMCRDDRRKNEKRKRLWIRRSLIYASNSKVRRQAWVCWQWTLMSLRKSCKCCNVVC